MKSTKSDSPQSGENMMPACSASYLKDFIPLHVAFTSSACVKKEEERMYRHCVWGSTPGKIFHGECDPVLQESKQEPPGPGWAGARSRPKRKWLREASGCGGFSPVVVPSSLRPHWHQKPRKCLTGTFSVCVSRAVVSTPEQSLTETHWKETTKQL